MARALCIVALVAAALVAALVARPLLPEQGRSEARLAGSPPATSTARQSVKAPPHTASEPDSRSPRRQAGRRTPRIHWRQSVAIGLPEAGRLVRGVLLPPEGVHYFTWDPILKQQPNRASRRWGTDDLIRKTLRVIRAYAEAHPGAPRVGIGDLSRQHGGDFGPEFGGIGHATHQNGLDADVYYPRLDRRGRAPRTVGQIAHRLAQDLVDRFVRAGVQIVFVGPNTGLHGPAGVVQVL